MKGRPEGSIVRNRLIAILERVNSSYGYELYKLYTKVFGKVHIRTIYYNLKKGIEKEEIIVVNVSREIGSYSWGDEVEKVYYTVGPYTKSTVSKSDKKNLQELKKEKKEVKIDWEKEIKNLVVELKKEFEKYNKRFDKMSNQAKKILKQRLKEKHKKIKQYSQNKISKEKLNLLTKDLNPDTL